MHLGYSQSQQVFSFGLRKGLKSFSTLVDRFVDTLVGCSAPMLRQNELTI